MNQVTYPLSSVYMINFPPEISKYYQTKKYGYRLHFHTKFVILFTQFSFFDLKRISVSLIVLSLISFYLCCLQLFCFQFLVMIWAFQFLVRVQVLGRVYAFQVLVDASVDSSFLKVHQSIINKRFYTLAETFLKREKLSRVTFFTS